MVNLLDRILGSTGQERTAALRDLGRRAEYYVPPEMRGILGFAAEMTPSETLNRAAAAGGEMLAPGRTPMQRVGSAGRMLSETAGVAAPMAVGPRAGMTAAQSLQEGLLGFSMAADDAGRRFVERMNQPGLVPTMYSGPAGFADYLKRVNPRGVRVAAEDRPNLMMGDMYGMLPSGAKRVGKQGDVTFYRGQEGDFYATAFNPDVGEQDVVGYIMPRGDMTELAVVDEMQGQGIGGELQYLFRKENPDAPTGGLTEAGEKALRKTYERLSGEGLLGTSLPTPRNEAEAMAKQVLEMRAAGRAGDVTEEMMAAADPQYMFANTPLPMDEASRMARAREMGFGGDLYHGSAADFPAFDQANRGRATSAMSAKRATWMTDEPDVAGGYATFAEGGPVQDLINRSYMAEADGDFDLADDLMRQAEELELSGTSAQGANIQPLRARGNRLLFDADGEKYDANEYVMMDKLNEAQRGGYAGLQISNFVDNADYSDWTEATHVGIFDPRNIRSRFARFDPAFAHLRNLSAGVGGLGLLSGLYSQEDTQ